MCYKLLAAASLVLAIAIFCATPATACYQPYHCPDPDYQWCASNVSYAFDSCWNQCRSLWCHPPAGQPDACHPSFNSCTASCTSACTRDTESCYTAYCFVW